MRMIRDGRLRQIVFLAALPLVVTAARALPADEDGVSAETYAAASIPESLRADAHAVIRYHHMSFEVFDSRRALLTVHQIITVLDPVGREFGELTVWYDLTRVLKRLDGEVYDARGNKVRSLDDRDVRDMAAVSSFSLYEDNRVRTARLYADSYPYTVEYVYQVAYGGYLNWPTWSPQRKGASVEFSQYVVTLPDTMRLRSWTTFLAIPSIERRNGRVATTWEVSGLRPRDPEPLGPDLFDQYPCVRVAPTSFALEGTTGDLSSWASFGKWCGNLYAGRQELPAEIQKQVHTITASARSEREKIRLLYEYMQSKTRYVSVQLGIGGWQPFPAGEVAAKGYGDCKALSNYMGSLLAAVGIPSYPTLIQAGSPPRRFAEEFPENVFNHVILMVPAGGDTVWLECTDQTAPFGSLSRNTEDRPCLALTPAGGILLRTPASRSGDNVQIQSVSVVLGPTGDAMADVHSTFSGNKEDFVRQALRESTPKAREEWLREHISVPAFRLREPDFTGVDGKDGIVSIRYRLELPRLASTAGARMLFPPNLLERDTYVPPPDDARANPIIHSYPYVDIDSVLFVLPLRTSVETTPEPTILETPFASYAARTTSLDASTLLHVRRLEIKNREIPAEAYGAYREFFEKVARADRQQAVLVRQ